MNGKAEVTALITPVAVQAQDEARALAGRGEKARAVKRLCRDSGLMLRDGEAALDLLNRGVALPTSYAQALEGLRSADALLAAGLENLLRQDEPELAVEMLRTRTDVEPGGIYRLIQEFEKKI